MGCLVNLIKIFLGIIAIVIMLIAGYKLVFDPYRPETSDYWSRVHTTESNQNYNDGEYQSTQSKEDAEFEVPVQTGSNHEYIMENTFQKSGVVMELTPQLESGLVYVIKVFKSQFGQDFSPTITSAHDSFDRHDQWSKHRSGRAVDIRMNDLPLNERRRVVRILEQTLPKNYKVIWEDQYTPNEHIHFQSQH